MAPNYDYNKRRISGSQAAIERERKRRQSLWEQIKRQHGDCEGVPNAVLRDLRINRGRTIFLDYEEFTKELDEANGVTVSISVKQRDAGASAIAVPYPNSKNVNRDKAAINASKNCRQLGLPIFVVFRNRDDKLRDVRLGHIEACNDELRQFDISIRSERAQAST